MENSFTNIGKAYRRYSDLNFGIRQADRLLHMYIVGQTGTGKSTLLYNLALQDARAGRGFCLIEPHGDLARQLSTAIDTEHIYWDIADPHSPYGYNPLARVSEKHRPLVASGLIETLKRQWADAWGVRMEHLLRHALLVLLAQPQCDLSDIQRLFVDKDFRRAVVAKVSDPQVRQFWTAEFPNMNYKNAADGYAPIANKLGTLLAYPVIRKVLCDPAEPLRFRKLMDEGQCVVINLAKGRLGSDVSNVMGGLIASSVMHAAFSRHDVAEATRKPFFLYVDEFHAFSSTAFASMLSEIRKYGIGLVLSHQFLSQTEPETLDAIMGNVGTQILFRLGALDAQFFSRQHPEVSAHSFAKLPNHEAYVQLMVQGTRSKIFSAQMHGPMC